MAKKKSRRWFVMLALLVVAAVAGFYLYKKFVIGKIHLQGKNYTYIFIEQSDGFEDVVSDINAENIIDDIDAFEWLARKMELDKNIHPGKYRLNNGMTMRQIINLIKYNKQEKVKLNYNSQIHNMDEFVEYTDDKLALSEAELEDFITDEAKLEKYFRLNPDNCFAMIVPGVYEVSWAIDAEELFELLSERYNRVWNARRIAQAKKLGYSVPEVMALASIVQSESSIESEQERIAGVYINRLRKNMLLQADPTLKFANKIYDAQRVLDKDKDINSPYNTYKYKGLPPGPICLVTTQAIDATLNYMRHNYIFFCAKPQLNGFSDYSTTYAQHQKYADAYKKALDRRGINR
jgi:UPF0755 protein